MGESKLKLTKREEMLLSCAGIQTMTGRVQVRWDAKSTATPMGQLAYFIEFLTLMGLWSRWLESCPLRYASPNAPTKVEVMGTWLLSILSGHKRYFHVTAIRCDGVNPELLGMGKVISEDALRNALKRIPETEGTVWLDAHLSGQQRERRQAQERKNPQRQCLGQRLLCEFAQAAAHSRCALKDKFAALNSRKGHKKSIVALAHKILRTLFAMLKNNMPYRDKVVDYVALSVKRNAPRWIKMLVKHGFMPAAAA